MRVLSVCGAVVLAGALVAGCASSGGEAPERAGDAATVEHIYGTTTVDEVPERIVATSSQWVDALLELGVQPVGYLSAGTMGDERGLYPWESAVSADAVEIDGATTASGMGPLPVEEIAALDPDLILGNWQIDSRASYDTLAAVAPTVAPLGAAGVDRWDDQLRALGVLLGRSDDAERVIAERAAAIDEAALPGLAGRTAVLAQFLFGDQQFVVVADPEDGAATLFEQLGMTLPPALVEEAGVSLGRLTLSPERVDALVADLLIILPNGGTAEDLMALPGFDRLPAVTNGGLAVVDYPTVVAFNTPSSLSIGYALDIVRPQLEAIAGG